MSTREGKLCRISEFLCSIAARAGPKAARAGTSAARAGVTAARVGKWKNFGLQHCEKSTCGASMPHVREVCRTCGRS